MAVQKRKTYHQLMLTGCSYFYPSISVDVADGYLGWCYLIPVTDTAGFTFNRFVAMFTA
jgi:hypothetical protein